MSVPKAIRDAKGLWHGKSQLNLPFLPPGKQFTESNSSLHIETDGQDTYATITYNWHQDGKRQEGTLLVCEAGKSRRVQIGWVDSWHQNSAVMYLSGNESEGGVVNVKGTYSAGKEVWGWTISFQLADGQFFMNMENLTPTGEATWAVKAAYSRD
jgi:hypothetical protein